MRVQPRRQILDIWESLLRVSYTGTGGQRGWQWGSGEQPDSLSDAEQLLVLLRPMNDIETFALHSPDRIKPESDLYVVLEPAFRTVSRVPAAVIEICESYFERHTRDGEPSFTGGSHLFPCDPDGPEPAAAQRESIEVVDSFSMSITLCLAVLAFVIQRSAEKGVGPDQAAKLEGLRETASRRLTAAMTGLVRCFVVNAVFKDDEVGKNILDNLGRGRSGQHDSALAARFHERMTRTRARLRANVTLGLPDGAQPDDEQLFELGWTWGVARDAGVVDIDGFGIAGSPGLADSRPYLYFTVVALDGIVDLFSARVRDLELFDEVQTRLVDALRIRWELTQRYWSNLARFDPEAWPLEDLPWRASDGEASDYYSLLVTSVLIKDFDDRKPDSSDLDKAVAILSGLADRAKITKRMVPGDPAMELHTPGTRLRLTGSESDGPLLVWHAADFTPMLLKRAFQAMRLTTDVAARLELTRLAEAAMDQLDERLITHGPASGLWDDTSRLMPAKAGALPLRAAADLKPSWNYTERVVEGLVTAVAAYQEGSPRSPAEYRALMAMFAEADHLYNQQLLTVDIGDLSLRRQALGAVELRLRQARAMERTRSSTAAALVQEALLLLAGLAEADDDARRDG